MGSVIEFLDVWGKDGGWIGGLEVGCAQLEGTRGEKIVGGVDINQIGEDTSLWVPNLNDTKCNPTDSVIISWVKDVRANNHSRRG